MARFPSMWCLALMLAVASSAAAQTSQPDDPSPKAVLSTFMGALYGGDAAAAKAMALPGKYDEGIDAMAALSASLKKLTDAAVKAYGEAGANLHPFDLAAATRPYADTAEHVQGDIATVSPGDQSGHMILRKVDGQWKVDLSSMGAGDRLVENAPMFRAITAAANMTADEIQNGKYATYEEAQKAFRQALSAVISAHRAVPTSQPTSDATTPTGQGEAPAAPAPAPVGQ